MRNAESFEFKECTFESYNFPSEKFDLVNAHFSLPFTREADFNRVFSSMIGSIKTGGIFCGQLFGNLHEWAQVVRQDRNFHTNEQVRDLFKGMEIIEMKEVFDDWLPDLGNRIVKGHIFNIIARKKILITSETFS